MERTLGIIKPDAVAKNVIGPILACYEKAGLTIKAMEMKHLTQSEAQGFYEVHKERPFYHSLVGFMTSGPCVVLVLEGENAVAKNREIMGATNPEQAAEGTIRKQFATNIERNAVHGSDSPENAKKEIHFFFEGSKLL